MVARAARVPRYVSKRAQKGVLDYWLAGLLLEADQGRRAMGLSLAS
jgi:hypothetical protein